MLVSHCVTVAIAHLVLKRYSLIYHVLVVGLQFLLLFLVVHRLLHVSFLVQLLSRVAMQALIVAILETAFLVQCQWLKNVLVGM